MPNLVPITKAALLERLAEVDSLLDIMEHHDADLLMVERRDIISILDG